MKREVYESRKAFAGEKVPSMQRRCVDHDYTERMMYMITMTTEGRRPLFGKVVGCCDAAPDTPDAPHIELTALGQRVADEWWGISNYYPQVEIIALQMMPDHLHGILFIKEKMEKDLSRIIRGFKTGCNRAYRELFPQVQPAASSPAPLAASSSVQPAASASAQLAAPSPVLSAASAPSLLAVPSPVQSAATASAPFAAPSPVQSAAPAPLAASSPVQSAATESLPTTPSKHEDRTHGFLFARGFNDKLLLRDGQLQRWLDYLADNPRRLLMKRAHPDLLRVRLDVDVCGTKCSAVGNLALLSAPQKLRVRISRSIAPSLLEQEKARLLAAARAGAVLVTPAISPGEKAVARAAFDEGLPLIVLLDNGLDPMDKPSGERFRACSEGRLLLLSPFPHHNERIPITRAICEALNGLAWEISGGK